MSSLYPQFSDSQKRQYFEQLLGELPLHNNGQWISRPCPLHSDLNPSFAINIDTWAWKCFAGCGQGDIYNFEMFLTNSEFKQAAENIADIVGPPQLPPEPQDPAKRKYSAVYTYTDLFGNPYFKIGRYMEKGEKKFEVAHKTASGHTVYKKPEKTYPYHVHRLSDAKIVWITEGEKCADLLFPHVNPTNDPLTAVTTNPFGAGSWKEEYSENLKSKHVIILPDNDDTGRKHAVKVANSVFKHAASVRIIELPGLLNKEDIEQFINRHGQNTQKKLIELLVQSSPWCPTNTSAIEGITEADPATTAVLPTISEMPDTCLYGWLGEQANYLDVSLGYAYPALLGAASTLGIDAHNPTRSNLYVCLIGPPGRGKTQAITRATQLIGLSADNIIDGPASDKGLYMMLKDKQPGSRVLLCPDELSIMMSKIRIQNSTLGATLCKLWSTNTASTADKTGTYSLNASISIAAGLACKEPSDFVELFGAETQAGLYDRFIYGYSNTQWDWRDWTVAPEYQQPSSVTIPAPIFDFFYDWKKENKHTDPTGRLGENALRIALITASMNGDYEVTYEGFKAALEFIRWQVQIRNEYKAGVAKNQDAQITEAILSALESLPNGALIKWSTLAKNRNWYKKFGPRAGDVRDKLKQQGLIIYDTTKGTISRNNSDGD